MKNDQQQKDCENCSNFHSGPRPWFRPELSIDGVSVILAACAVIVFLVTMHVDQVRDEQEQNEKWGQQTSINYKLQQELDDANSKLDTIANGQTALSTLVHDRLNVKE